MKKKKKKRGHRVEFTDFVNEHLNRNQFLVDGPIHTKVDGTKKGRQGYTRKDKKWKDEE
jgi:hypothetical protein